MVIHFVTTEVDLQSAPIELQQEIEAELKKQGDPLRWAITSIDIERQKAFVEAIITVATT